MKMIDTFSFLLLTLVIFAVAGMVQAQSVSFAPPQVYNTGVWPYDIANGDLNGDGNPDLVTANASAWTLGILLNNGDGTFQNGTSLPVGPTPTGVTVGDFDLDGRQDMAVAEFGHVFIRVFRGNGDGTFQSGVAYYAAGQPLVVIATDLNNDNKPDLVTGNYNSSAVAVLIGNGDGTFQGAVQFAGGGTETGLVASDFNQDGNTDIAATTKFRPYGIVVLFGNGDGTLGPPSQYNANDNPEGISAGNFNGDNYPDLVVGNTGGGNRVSVLLNNGDGTFQPPVSYSTLTLVTADVAVKDIDLDGKLDIVASQNGQPTYIAVFLGNGNGTFQSAINIPFSGNSENPATITIADFNADSRPDVATANRSTNTATVLLNTTVVGSPLTSLGPAGIWIGLKNSDDVGIRFDLRAEAYRGETLVGSGELGSVHGGSSGFNNARLNSITMTPIDGTRFLQGETLGVKLFVRNACTGSGKNSGRARLWFNDAAANSSFDATIGSSATYYLRSDDLLTTSLGGGPKNTIDVQAGSKCSAYKTFGTWSITLP